ncbi:Oligopeptide transport system permease protein OppB [Methanosarcina siciliae HI350]|uniref:Nickel import system ATP-binding protein NikD n=1 Tax=Methanosarcina siciliae HI350 TaxID=1434119 RepID=A0A0E3LBN0_9EURY|nr:ABC transporter ATP-binding protein [Methanosarcina siciliae]AKB34056.1 Oligopeptide transport system permease protein OppB [Methanosarcina siciliae HI350]
MTRIPITPDPGSRNGSPPLLEIRNLKVHFPDDTGPVKAVDSIDIIVREKECFGIIGESGSGKTVLCLAILGLLAGDASFSGEIIFKGENLFSMSSRKIRKIRGKEIGAIFQNPATSLDPVFTIGDQLSEALIRGEGFSKAEVNTNLILLLNRVSIRDPALRIRQYPHELSGGLRQRVMIAMGIAAAPSLIIADEPSSGLDLRIKRRIISLLQDISRNASMFIVTHDLELAEKLFETLAVMYAGEIVEIADCKEFFKAPMHPFSEGLLNSLPSRGMQPIPGSSPSLTALPEGCRFFPRCRYAMEICKNKHPELFHVMGKRQVRCFKYA